MTSGIPPVSNFDQGLTHPHRKLTIMLEKVTTRNFI